MKALVIGAGMTGLSTAWHLQEYGYEVTVLDRIGVAAGSSWGNAGWLAPGKTIPLSNAGLWLYGPTALLDKNAAMAVPPRLDPKLWAFVAQFMARANKRSWDKTMAALTPADKAALAAFDELIEGGVDAVTYDRPFVVGFEEEKQAAGFLEEIEGAIRHGQDILFRQVSHADARALAPMLSDRVQATFTLDGQRFIEPALFCNQLADALRSRGADIRTGVEVTQVVSTRRPGVKLATGEWLDADAVVIATGAWLPNLAKDLGVRTLVQAGRGYSFTVETDEPATHSVYLPHTRVACTPVPSKNRFQIAGTMEFRGPDEAFQPARVEAIINSTKPMFQGVNWDSIEDQWVGSRPVTPDGLPLVGATQAPNVYTCGGHGMWGIILGPISGKLLAKQIATGEVDPVIKPFDPLR